MSDRAKTRSDQSLRRQVMREWYGCDQVLDLNHRVFGAEQWVDAVLEHSGLSEGIDAETLRQAWCEVAGGFIAGHSRPQSLLRGVLTLQVTQPSMRFHLEQMRGELLRSIHQQLPQLNVKSLRFALG